MKNSMEARNLSPHTNENDSGDIEILREKLAEKVRSNLEKYKEEIEHLSIFTASAKNGNGFHKTGDIPFAQYKDGYDSDFEVKGVPKENGTISDINYIGEPAYVYHKPMNWGSFYAPIGKCLHTPDRPGNMIAISMKGIKGKIFSQELVDSIFDLIKTIKKSDDLKEIATEAIPIFEAFKETADRFQDPKSPLTAQKMIDEYKEIINTSN